MKKGTVIAKVAKPIAKTIDIIFHTDIQNCGGCDRMENNLNAGMSLADSFYDRFWPEEETDNKQQTEKHE